MTLALDGNRLTLSDTCAIARARTADVTLAPSALDGMNASRALIERLAAGDAPIYAVNTGVGLLADVRIPAADLERLQRNVIRSHCAGVGEPLARDVVRAMMLIRANVLAKGLSGIRPLVAERICALVNRGVTPVVPSQGSVGASGDLAPLAHMALVLIGEGEAEFEGSVMPGADARYGGPLSEPLPSPSPPRKVSGLINGTQAMLAIGCLELDAVRTSTDSADLICAHDALDALRGTPRAFDERIHAARPHSGQWKARRSLAPPAGRQRDSPVAHYVPTRAGCSLKPRCAPQVHGAVRDVVAAASVVFDIELNSATDNPLVFDGDESSRVRNFHGEPLAVPGLDFLGDRPLCALSGISGAARRPRLGQSSAQLELKLPPFLAGSPGLESGLMMAQVTAASLVAENRVLGSIPHLPDPSPPVAIKKTLCQHGHDLLGGENCSVWCATPARPWPSKLPWRRRALDLLLAPAEIDARTIEAARERIRAVSPPLDCDRPYYRDMIAALEAFIESGALRAI